MGRQKQQLKQNNKRKRGTGKRRKIHKGNKPKQLEKMKTLTQEQRRKKKRIEKRGFSDRSKQAERQKQNGKKRKHRDTSTELREKSKFSRDNETKQNKDG